MKSFDDIVSEQLSIPRESLRDSLTASDIPNWDSMNYLLLIAELEKIYNISFSMDEVLSSQSLGSLKELMRSKGATI